MTKRKPAHRVLACLFALMLLCAALAPPAYAETPAERYARLQQELKETRAEIEKTKNDLNAAKQHKEALEQEKAIIDEMVALNLEEIDNTQQSLDAKQQEVALKRQAIFENDELLQQRLIAIYNMNNATVLSQLLSVDSFSEAFTVIDAMRRISQHDTDFLAMLSTQRTELETEQQEIDTLLAELNAYHAELTTLQAQLAQNIMDADSSISAKEAELAAQKEIEGEQYAELLAAQQEMARIQSSIGGSTKNDGSEFVGGRFTWPVPASYAISCEFGSPDPNGVAHRGMDIRAPIGTTIVACGNGTVITAAYAHSSYGNYVVIDHGNGVKTLYAHCDSLSVGVGTAVSTGMPIATVGVTGFVTGAHLHLEVHNGGALENPRAWLSG